MKALKPGENRLFTPMHCLNFWKVTQHKVSWAIWILRIMLWHFWKSLTVCKNNNKLILLLTVHHTKGFFSWNGATAFIIQVNLNTHQKMSTRGMWLSHASICMYPHTRAQTRRLRDCQSEKGPPGPSNPAPPGFAYFTQLVHSPGLVFTW